MNAGPLGGSRDLPMAFALCGSSSLATSLPHLCQPFPGRGCYTQSETPLHTEVPVKGLCDGSRLAQPFSEEAHI